MAARQTALGALIACRKQGAWSDGVLKEYVRRDQLDRMAALGMVPSVFVGHVYYWGDVHLRNLGPDRGGHISPCRWMLEAGLPLNLHQDFPVTRPDMLHSIWCAVNRLSRTGQALGPDQRIDPYDAFRAACWGGAYGYHEESQKGTLEPGKRANVVVLDQNLELKDVFFRGELVDRG